MVLEEEKFEGSALTGDSVDDLLAQAASFMKTMGLDTEVVEEALKEEEPVEEVVDEISDFYAYVNEEEAPDYNPPIEIKKFEEIDRIEQMQLEERYGQQDVGRFAEHGSVIAEVRTLDKYERNIFLKEDFVTPEFNLQYLYKVKCDMDRRDIVENIGEFLANNPLLRVNFCPIGVDAKMKKILFKRKKTAASFYSMKFLIGDALNKSIEKMMSDERQKPFDLSSDTLMRVTLIKVGEEDYAVIVTISRLIVHVFNEREFFYRVFNVAVPRQIPKDVVEESKYSDNMASYYHKLLKDLPPTPKIPRFKKDYNKYIARIHQTFLHPEFYKILKKKSFGKSDIMMAMLGTAWGLLQKQVNYNRETYFALLLSDHNLGETAKVNAGKIYPLPLRIAINDDTTLSDITGKLLRQMLTSRSIGCTKMKYVLKPFGDPSELFQGYLHFHDFSKVAEDFDKVKVGSGYKLIDIKSFDAGREDLGIYFGMRKEGLAITYRYNPFCFNPRTISPLAKYYEIAIGCLLLTYEQSFNVFENVYKENIKGWDQSFGTYIL